MTEKDRSFEAPGTASAVAASHPPDQDRAATTLDVDVVWGDLTKVQGNVFAVGHYIGVLPQYAELTLDQHLSGLPDAKEGDPGLFITDQTRRGALRGALGETLLFPWSGKGHVALAGMGRLGAFREAELRVLVRSLVSTTCRLLPEPTICSVIIGSGAGNLETEEAAQAFLVGAVEALAADGVHRLGRLRLVERELDRALDAFDAVSARARDLDGKTPVTIRCNWVGLPDSGGLVSARFACSMALATLANTMKSDDADEGALLERLLRPLPLAARDALGEELRLKAVVGVPLERIALGFRLGLPRESASTVLAARVSFLHDNLQLRQAAITNRTTTTERVRVLPLDWLDRIVERLQAPPLESADQDAAKAWRRLVHADLKEPLTGDSSPLVLEVDSNTARVPWELLREGTTEVADENSPDHLGLRRPVARQLRTTYSPRPGETTESKRLNALVIGDPDDSLPSAVTEARKVYESLTGTFGFTATLRLGPPDGNNKSKYAGVAPAGLYEVLGDLLDGEFDLVHYCGHAHFDERFPGRSGWVFANGVVLTPSMLEGIDRPPRLIVANACQSAVTSVPHADGKPGPVGDSNAAQDVLRTFNGRFLPGLADEFFRRGVSDFIGTAWEVRDQAAMLFATTFYDCLLSKSDPAPLGVAVQKARLQLYKERRNWKRDGALWAAYQHYGDPTRLLRLRADPQTARKVAV